MFNVNLLNKPGKQEENTKDNFISFNIESSNNDINTNKESSINISSKSSLEDKKNIDLFDAEKSQLILTDVQQYLAQVKNQYFDIILADPPYAEVSFESAKDRAEHFLKPGGIFCMEMKKESIDETNVRVKHYGSTQVVFWKSVA